MRTSMLMVAAYLALSPAAASQFSQFTWTEENPGGFLMFPGPTQLGIGGGSGSADGIAYFSATAPVDAFVTAMGTTIATPKGGCGDSQGLYGEASSLNVLGDCSTLAPLSFSVHAGALMIFGLEVVDTTLPGDVYYSEFVFTPFWEDLGGALAGAAGAPVLKGVGVPEPDETLRLLVSDAVPSATAVLVLGLDEVNLPFKGGLLVPAPDILVIGLSTSATGTLILGGMWPASAGSIALLAQLWVADAGGPHGWAATNAVKVTAY